MKTLKSKLLMLTLSLIGVVAMSFALVNKETPEAKAEVKVQTTFHYASESTSPGAFANPDNWQSGGSPVACNTGEEKPCQITAEDEADLASKLSGRNNDQVLAIVDSRRE